MSRIRARADDVGGRPLRGTTRLTEYVDEAPGRTPESLALKELGRYAVSLGWTAARLATESKIDATNLRDVFLRKTPRVATVERVAAALGVSGFETRALLDTMSDDDLGRAREALGRFLLQCRTLFRRPVPEVDDAAGHAFADVDSQCRPETRRMALRAFVVTVFTEQNAGRSARIQRLANEMAGKSKYQRELPAPLAVIDAKLDDCDFHVFHFRDEFLMDEPETEPALWLLLSSFYGCGISSEYADSIIEPVLDAVARDLDDGTRRVRAALAQYRDERRRWS